MMKKENSNKNRFLWNDDDITVCMIVLFTVLGALFHLFYGLTHPVKKYFKKIMRGKKQQGKSPYTQKKVKIKSDSERVIVKVPSDENVEFLSPSETDISVVRVEE
ncbi:hypothetical protein QR692_10225 [Lactococcus petauri]|uniref:hypothetical protein n=1 Tax=Lactococcus petauri TaxID=1940789 RepID=UPI002078E14F|nr:hypothetical protein [Lactococcus petauri]USI65359.1 hypothetical protein LMK05_11110 [Lactococcus petauri]USI67854.1 hypothetical protein LMK04_10345 [Lactococcus petauri]WJE12515.1 hypothetical protein QR692_10225 [Lactococcus petauri]